MTEPLKVSVILASHGRPEGLRRVLVALQFQFFRNFEVVVVSDQPETRIFSDLACFENTRFVFFDETNLSRARNIGIENAAGDILAFCDDDAVPEPLWLERLVTGFTDPSVGAAGGYVKARNGINYQWTAARIDTAGRDLPLTMPDYPEGRTVSFDGESCAKLQGTNCAFRRIALAQVGAFDETYRFFLEDGDMAIRLSMARWNIAIIPDAEVQHGFAQSARRRHNRVPVSLFEEGRSKTAFLLRHASTTNVKMAKEEFIELQKYRLLHLMVAGKIEPRDVENLLQMLSEGLDTPKDELAPIIPKIAEQSGIPFQKYLSSYKAPDKSGIALGGSIFSKKPLEKAALKQVATHRVVTVFKFSHTLLFHKRYFDSRGFWVQTGGLLGRSERSDRVFSFFNIPGRIKAEVKKLTHQRHIEECHYWRFGLKVGMIPACR